MLLEYEQLSGMGDSEMGVNVLRTIWRMVKISIAIKKKITFICSKTVERTCMHSNLGLESKIIVMTSSSGDRHYTINVKKKSTGIAVEGTSSIVIDRVGHTPKSNESKSKKGFQ